MSADTRIEGTPVPPRAPLAVTLGSIIPLLSDSRTHTLSVSRFSAHPAGYICVLPDDTLYFWNHDLDVNDDGYTTPQKGDEAASQLLVANKPTDWLPGKYHQETTSFPGLSAFVHPYIVLPWGSGRNPSRWWLKETKCRPGDGAVAISADGRWTQAVFGDSGPDNKIGEMSLAAHARFVGWDTLFTRSGTHSSTKEVSPASGPLVTLVFPFTGTPATPKSEGGFEQALRITMKKAAERFWALAGHTIPPT